MEIKGHISMDKPTPLKQGLRLRTRVSGARFIRTMSMTYNIVGIWIEYSMILKN